MSEPLDLDAEYGFPVGEYLKDELDARGWTTADCAARMGGDAAVNELTLELHLAVLDAPPDHAIHRGTMAEDTAEGLARAFGTSADVWLNLDRAYHQAMGHTNI